MHLVSKLKSVVSSESCWWMWLHRGKEEHLCTIYRWLHPDGSWPNWVQPNWLNCEEYIPRPHKWGRYFWLPGSLLYTIPHWEHSGRAEIPRCKNVNGNLSPVGYSKLLSSHKNSPAFDKHLYCRHMIDKLNYLEKCTKTIIAFAAYQYTRFSSDPIQPCADVVKW